MSARITIVDYGCGNILSIANAIAHCGAAWKLSSCPDEIRKAEKLILPGVGAFGHCRDRMSTLGQLDAVRDYIAKGNYLLGICVGMQILFTKSSEYGIHSGLDVIKGQVTSIQLTQNKDKRVPFVGWAKLEGEASLNQPMWNERIGDWVYFVHSFKVTPGCDVDSRLYYRYFDEDITAFVSKDNVMGCQFHPEKSGEVGLKIFKSFIKM